jgi:hypothetical protein
MVEQVCREEKVDFLIRETCVDTLEEAHALSFPGSPTVRIEGKDIDPSLQFHSTFGLG